MAEITLWNLTRMGDERGFSVSMSSSPCPEGGGEILGVAIHSLGDQVCLHPATPVAIRDLAHKLLRVAKAIESETGDQHGYWRKVKEKPCE